MSNNTNNKRKFLARLLLATSTFVGLQSNVFAATDVTTATPANMSDGTNFNSKLPFVNGNIAQFATDADVVNVNPAAALSFGVDLNGKANASLTITTPGNKLTSVIGAKDNVIINNLGINFGADVDLTIGGANAINLGNISANAANNGTLNLNDKVSVLGKIGDGNAIKTINVSGTVTANNDVVTSNGIILTSGANLVLDGSSSNAASIGVVGGIDFNGTTSTITAQGAKSIRIDNIIAGGNGVNLINGTLAVNMSDTTKGLVVTNAVGDVANAATKYLGNVNITNGVLQFNNTAAVKNVIFNGDGTLRFVNTAVITGNVTTATTDQGTISFGGTGTFNDINIGTATASLKQLTSGLLGNLTLKGKGSIYANNIATNNNTSIVLDTNSQYTFGAFNGNTTPAANGSTNAVISLNANAQLTLAGVTKGAYLSLHNGSQVSLSNDYTGTIVNEANANQTATIAMDLSQNNIMFNSYIISTNAAQTVLKLKGTNALDMTSNVLTGDDIANVFVSFDDNATINVKSHAAGLNISLKKNLAMTGNIGTINLTAGNINITGDNADTKNYLGGLILSGTGQIATLNGSGNNGILLNITTTDTTKSNTVVINNVATIGNIGLTGDTFSTITLSGYAPNKGLTFTNNIAADTLNIEGGTHNIKASAHDITLAVNTSAIIGGNANTLYSINNINGNNGNVQFNDGKYNITGNTIAVNTLQFTNANLVFNNASTSVNSNSTVTITDSVLNLAGNTVTFAQSVALKGKNILSVSCDSKGTTSGNLVFTHGLAANSDAQSLTIQLTGADITSTPVKLDLFKDSTGLTQSALTKVLGVTHGTINLTSVTVNDDKSLTVQNNAAGAVEFIKTDTAFSNLSQIALFDAKTQDSTSMQLLSALNKAATVQDAANQLADLQLNPNEVNAALLATESLTNLAEHAGLKDNMMMQGIAAVASGDDCLSGSIEFKGVGAYNTIKGKTDTTTQETSDMIHSTAGIQVSGSVGLNSTSSIGAVFSANTGTIKDNTENKNQYAADINTYGGSLYSQIGLGADARVGLNIAATVGKTDVTSKNPRLLQINGTSVIAKSDYSMWSLGGSATASYRIDINDNMGVSVFAGINAAYLSLPGFEQQDAQFLNLKVQDSNLTRFGMHGGVTGLYAVQMDSVKLTVNPFIKVMGYLGGKDFDYQYSLINATNTATNTVTGSRFMFNPGIDFNANMDAVQVGIGYSYNGDFDTFSSNAGNLHVKINL